MQKSVSNILEDVNEPFSICIFSKCKLKSIKGYDFCYQHIDMFDRKNKGKVKQCEWVDEEKSGERCNQLVHLNRYLSTIEDRTGQNGYRNLCVTHLALEKLKNKRKIERDEKEKASTTETTEEAEKRQKVKKEETAEEDPTTSSNLIEKYLNDPKTRELLDSSDSLDEIALNIFEKQQPGSSSSRSTTIKLDYDHDLNHAGVYTRDEIVRIFKVKMSKLQLLYKKQMQMLAAKMKDEQGKYEEMKKSEKEGGLNRPNTSGGGSKRDLKYLRATRKYRALNEKEIYLKQKYEPSHFDSPHSIYNVAANESVSNKCMKIIGTSGERCTRTCLSLSKYCKKHILSDSAQVLFSECGAETSTGVCKNVVVASLNSHCALHLAYSAGCLNNAEANGLIKLDEAKINSITHRGANDYPPESLREIASRLRSKKMPDSELSLLISNGTNLVRIKQEILDQSSLYSEDEYARVNPGSFPNIQVKQEEKEYAAAAAVADKSGIGGDLEVIVEEQGDDEETAGGAAAKSAADEGEKRPRFGSYSSTTSTTSSSSSSSSSPDSSSDTSSSGSGSSSSSSSSSSASSSSSSSSDADSDTSTSDDESDDDHADDSSKSTEQDNDNDIQRRGSVDQHSSDSTANQQSLRLRLSPPHYHHDD